MNGDSLKSILAQISKWSFNTFIHQCVAVIFIYVIWIPESYSNLFSWHVILSTLGILPFMIEALLLFSNDNVLSKELSRKQKYWAHGILTFLGAFFIITGIVLEYIRKDSRNAAHFKSGHAIAGLISMIFIIFALVCGFMAFSTSTFSKWIPPVWLKLIHNVLGQLGYISAIVCLCLGYYIGWFIRHTSEASTKSYSNICDSINYNIFFILCLEISV